MFVYTIKTPFGRYSIYEGRETRLSEYTYKVVLLSEKRFSKNTDVGESTSLLEAIEMIRELVKSKMAQLESCLEMIDKSIERRR